MPDARMQVTREQALAFRLDGHSLSRPRPRSALPDVAGACGVRNTPPGSAGSALAARVADLAPDALDAALADKMLVEVLGPRLSPHVVPGRDLAVFTLGALPAGDASLKGQLGSVAPALARAGIAPTEALASATEAAHAELADGPLPRGELSAGITRRIPDAMNVQCRACKSTHISESLFRLVGVAGGYVIERAGSVNTYVRTDHWLGADSGPDAGKEGRAASDTGAGCTGRGRTGRGRTGAGNTPASGDANRDAAAARAELLRRYLRCFGPSTLAHFAAWVGISADDARQTWEGMADDVVAVELDGRRAWVLADAAGRLQSPPEPKGIRLLPPYDAYLDQRDRATLVPDKVAQKRIWAALGNPGVVLAAGEVVALWRPRKQGKRLGVAVEAFASLTKTVRAEIEAEAAVLAPFRGCASAEVSLAG